MADTDTPMVRNLRRLMPGLSIYTEGSSYYQDCLKLYNHALSEQPLVCVRPRTEPEVSQLIQLCTADAIPFSVRSGGHDFFGRSLIHEGILIDMRAMDSIMVEPDRASARVGGGVIAGALQEKLDSYGLFTPTGQAKTVGYVSWACGGGYGFYVGTYGFGVDQILGARVVLAGGCVVDTDEDPELLWALRGAGAGTFGIVTELRVKVYPVPKLYAGFLAFPLAEAATVMDRMEKILDEYFPDEFSGDAIATHPQMTPILVSEPCFVLFWCWTAADGDLAPAKGFLDQIMQVGRVLGNTVTESKLQAFQARHQVQLTRSLQLSQPLTAWVTRRRPPSFAVGMLTGYSTKLAPSSQSSLHRNRCPQSFFIITMAGEFDMASQIKSGRLFRIDANMLFSGSMVALHRVISMARTLPTQPHGSHSWSRRLIKMGSACKEEGFLAFSPLTRWI